MSFQIAEPTSQQNRSAQGIVVTPERHLKGGCSHQVRKLRFPSSLTLPVCIHPAKRALAAAKAPSCLQKILDHYRKPTKRLVADCAWTEQLMKQPRLITEPPFGSCLAEVLKASTITQREDNLTGEKTIEPPLYPESLESSKKSNLGTRRFPSSKGVPHSIKMPNPRQGKSPHRTHSPRSGPQLFDHPARVSLEFLEKRAGGDPVASRIFHQQGTGRYTFSTDRKPSGFRKRVVLGDFNDWATRLAYRLRRRIEQSNRASGNLMYAHPESLNIHLTNFSPGWVARSLAVDPTGPSIPEDFLWHLVATDLNPMKFVPLKDQPSVLDRKASSSALLNNPAERSASGIPAWDAPFSTTPKGEAPAPVSQQPTGAKQGFYPQLGSLTLPAAGQPNFRPPLAPPLASEHNPTLLPPQEVFDAPTPIATALAQQAAKSDETLLLEEDLDDLADKIKRILDDEARRHGIQV